MKTIALFFGGPSNEHEVSIMSAGNVVKYFDYGRYKLILIYWHKKDRRFYKIKNIDKLKISAKNRIGVEDFSRLFDVALLMTHGRYGEDGILQAVLDSQKIKYCGCRVLSSAVCMDKAIFKNLLTADKINQTGYAVLDYQIDSSAELLRRRNKACRDFKFPLYVKPANSGSSVGISKITKPAQLATAVKNALKHDKKIVIEEGLVNPREIEVAVLGNEKLLVSRPGELRLAKDFYDYDDKYKKGEAQMIVPAAIDPTQTEKIRALAARAYRLADCRGFARVDFLIAKNKIYLNEINSLPGFTDISMFPMLMMDQGMSYRELLNKIIALAY
ncbi:TPA: D-alanine--D-alanine ligase A [Candidatus Falkowbacteria bacterium]|nr:MAG: D-alanine-D-alanine ligase [Candidatus Falkowbacteria bacterium GW2011_GWF2_43_32]HBA36804.1 D-alanine--D-alanine ligase A [Candidatus Falkowbacteria bacterium]